MGKKILLLNTSAAKYAGGDTGVWIEECAAPYYHFLAAGHEVAMASPAGGPSPIDQGSLGEGFFTDAAKKFMHDPVAFGMFSHQQKIADIDAAAYDAVYLVGGHGTVVDFVGNPALKALVEAVYAAGKVVAADCHGPVGLAECCKPDGSPLVKGLKVTGFTNAEEAVMGITEDKVGFFIENKFKELGGLYEGAADWNSKVCVDGNLITGQNPQSSDDCAKAVIAKLA